MAIMNVLTTDDMSYVKVEIRNVSVNYYRYDENIPKQLYERFKSDSPTKVTFGSENAYTHEFKKLLYNSGYEIKEDGTVVTRKREVCYNSIEHSIDTVKQSPYNLTVKSGYDENKLIEVLLNNGYIISTANNSGKTDVLIYGNIND
ncbi:hypothetical protein [Lysinibacillus sp. BPa_S21]|uniref:hypothetical protein n=1 Tax=Lysinibacillus sp. BPa_S21 TaxID=2932478 RepID=UPI00201150A8|nr:hypothetical protein [Lysinibacillus sp. BPa_S21]MCL1696413.1 hypothetical protein [Lysinibacillus sp. BPa_S21]